MIEMPPLQFAETNGIRMDFYEAGPKTDAPPVILCHGWPEIAFSWRHQIKALSEAGIRVIAPDQRGYGATDRPEPVESYDIEHLTGDLVGLLDHLKIVKAIFVGHDWGGFIVQFQDPGHGPDKIFGGRVEQTFDAFMKKPVPRADTAPAEEVVAGVGASPRLNLAFPQMIAGYDAKHDPRTPILSPEEKQIFVDTFTKTGFTGGINWYRNMSRNWQRSADIDHTVKVPSLMIMAENDQVLPPSSADGMEKIIPDLEKYLVRGSGHWTQQEKPDEVSAKLIEWRKKRFG
jgi:pimeloyl-ACP methyl ester carboxylesterase